MELRYDKIEYIFTDEHSQNDGIMIGYLQTGLDNLVKDILNNQILRIQFINIDDIEEIDATYIDAIKNSQNVFDWEYCENIYLLRAYNNFTKKMKRVFDGYYIKDKPTDALARQENTSVRAINSILKRCREEIDLQRRLEEADNAKKSNH